MTTSCFRPFRPAEAVWAADTGRDVARVEEGRDPVLRSHEVAMSLSVRGAGAVRVNPTVTGVARAAGSGGVRAERSLAGGLRVWVRSDASEGVALPRVRGRSAVAPRKDG